LIMKHRNGFTYLTELYAQYEAKIEMNQTSFTFEDIRPALYKLHEDLFDEFIERGSRNEINISYANRLKLIGCLGDKTHMEDFTSFGDFLHLYDCAILEVYQLMTSMYGFEFRKYCCSRQA